MTSLDDLGAMQKLDPQGVLTSTASYVDQGLDAWQTASKIAFSEKYQHCQNIVVSGMGGSQFPARAIKETFSDRLKVPYEIVNTYSLPNYVGENSLVVLSSYSGSTEETLSCAKEALNRKAMVSAVTKGGKLKEILSEYQALIYQFVDDKNPCGQPRIGGGYVFFGHLGILKALGVLEVNDEEAMTALSFAKQWTAKLTADVPEEKNPAKQLAKKLFDTSPVFVAGEFLRGVVNGMANQVNETAKMMSDFRAIPELNHHLMEGLQSPKSLHENGLFVFLESDLYSERIQKRFGITKEVVEKQNVKTLSLKLAGPTKLSQVLEALILSSFATFYLAMLYDLDPASIPWVDYFKERLGK